MRTPRITLAVCLLAATSLVASTHVLAQQLQLPGLQLNVGPLNMNVGGSPVPTVTVPNVAAPNVIAPNVVAPSIPITQPATPTTNIPTFTSVPIATPMVGPVRAPISTPNMHRSNVQPLVAPSIRNIHVAKDADVLVTKDGGITRIQNLTGVGKSVRVDVVDLGGKPRIITLDPGTELVAGPALSGEHLRPADGIARRGGTISGGLAITELDVGSVLKQTESIAKLITNPVNKAEKKTGDRILKTAAALLMLRGTDGFEFGSPSNSSSTAPAQPIILPPDHQRTLAELSPNAQSPQTPIPTPVFNSNRENAAIFQANQIQQRRSLADNGKRRVAMLPPNSVPVSTPGHSIPSSYQPAIRPSATASPIAPQSAIRSDGNQFIPAAGFSGDANPERGWTALRDQINTAIQTRPDVAAALILLFAVMFAVMTMLAATARRKAVELQKANLMLNSQIVERIAAEQEVTRLNRGLQAKLGELNELNEELTVTRDKAVEASRMKSEFVANISHEIRTPITAVLGMIGLLRDSSLNKKQDELLKMLDGSARSLLGVINDILDFSKIEAGMLLIQSVDFSVAGVVQETADVLAPAVAEKGLKLEINYEGEIPGTVSGDPFRLRQVLMNLLGNAVKFTEKGTVSLYIKRLDSPENTSIGFYVRDSGIGIAEHARNLLFQPFSQADGTTTRRFGGTGLGLSISKRLVDLMGGTIDFRSESGKGSEFWFVLPFEAAASEPTQAVDVPTPQQLLNSNGLPTRILVAEDSPVLQRIVLHQLEGLGCNVVLASNGLEAVEAIKTGQFDLVLMDWQMPQLDGIQATHQIRAMENGNIPIIAMTANAMERDRTSCLDAGMNDYISKPFTVDQLRKTIESWISDDTASGAVSSVQDSARDSY